MANGSFIPVTETEKIAERSFSCFKVKDVAVVICRFRDMYYALENQCSHAQSSFDDGRLRAYNLICPMHSGSFDIRDGSPTGLPARAGIRAYPVRVADGIIEVDLGESL